MREKIGVIAVAAMLVGPALAWLRLVPGLAGFVSFALGGLIAAVAGRRGAGTVRAWTTTAADGAGGTIEAVATTRLFGFQDDIAIRVRADGTAASRVDVRSKSREGKGDLGANAARIRAYVTELEASR